MEPNQENNPQLPKKPRRKRHSSREAKNLQVVKALLSSKSPAEAYMKMHPNCTPTSAQKNAKRMLTPEVMEEFRRVLAIDKLAIVNRDNLEKMLMLVVVGWTQGKEKTQDYLRAVEILTRLDPDFSKKVDLKDEAAINKRLEELGYKPNA
jgi:hypothetical protein